MNLVVDIADCQVSDDPAGQLVTYSLGSCIGVAIWDPEVHVGGMIHYMLPESSLSPEKAKANPAMFADTGLPVLFKSAYALGAVKKRLVVKVAGGSSLLDDNGTFNIGKRNYAALPQDLLEKRNSDRCRARWPTAQPNHAPGGGERSHHHQDARRGGAIVTYADEILASVGDVSPLPGTVARLVEVINNPRSTPKDIVEVIRYDQAVTSQMLRLCNSAYFGLQREVQSLDDAVRLLGTMKVLHLLMAVHGKALLADRHSGYGMEPGVLWKHSVAVALAASILGGRVSPDNVGSAFTAGLLHDIGKVVLNEYVGQEFARIARMVTEEHISFAEAENQVLGVSHEEIGEKVAQKWKLPEALVRCIRHHHRPQRTPAARSPGGHRAPGRLRLHVARDRTRGRRTALSSGPRGDGTP